MNEHKPRPTFAQVMASVRERMGSGATQADAYRMVGILHDGGWTLASDVPAVHWLAAIEQMKTQEPPELPTAEESQ